ncbi:hypothetical protein KP509_07G016800 [Ceratopteris richardii]|uniref:Uncharacterized protein n=1 Tax=Ceratopteris richardii TaxID=49495 RepID=A0A8T2U7T0_CERRI|nr:hypothetical protein KP509_07G016800 [Ceratopteris richardii]
MSTMVLREFWFLLVTIISATCAMHSCLARPLMMARTSRMLVLVASPTPSLTYHGGPLMTVRHLRLHVLWYGTFSGVQQAAIRDFLASFQATDNGNGGREAPTVRQWWAMVRKYKDANGNPPAGRISLGMEFSDTAYSRGKNLSNADMADMVDALYMANRKTRSSSMYVVMTAEDVLVEDFCMNSCGTHEVTAGAKVPFVWVGNAGKQCPGLCAWPFAVEKYGPPGPPLTPPNGDPAADGMVINLALLLAGAATNPFASGYFQGDASVPLEAGSACQGQFGPGSYPGYAGQLQTESSSGASFNVVGLNDRYFLLPAIWNPSTKLCQTP